MVCRDLPHLSTCYHARPKRCVTWSHTCLDTHKSNYVCLLPEQRPDQVKTQNHLIWPFWCYEEKHLHFFLLQNTCKNLERMCILSKAISFWTLCCNDKTWNNPSFYSPSSMTLFSPLALPRSCRVERSAWRFSLVIIMGDKSICEKMSACGSHPAPPHVITPDRQFSRRSSGLF